MSELQEEPVATYAGEYGVEGNLRTIATGRVNVQEGKIAFT